MTNKALSDVMKSEGWRANSAGDKCEKVYRINGRLYLCCANLSRDGEIWTAELFWPNEEGWQPCVPGHTLEEAARWIEQQIEVLCPEGHGRVDCEDVGV